MAQPCLRERIRSGLPVWSFAFLPVVVGVGVGYYRFLRHLPPAVGRWFLISAAVYQGGALGVEMIESLITANALPRLVIEVSQGVEESLEIAGISYFVYSLTRFLAMEQVPIQLAARSAPSCAR